MKKYGADNRKLARGEEAIMRFKQSSWRHFLSWQEGTYDENHNDGCIFNVMAYEYHRNRMLENDLVFDEKGNEQPRQSI